MQTNDYLQLLEILLVYTLVLAAYRMLGRIGLYSWICLASVIANLQVAKISIIFGLTATLGNATYASIFLATNILSEKYGKKSAQLAIPLGFCSMIIAMVLLRFALWYLPAPEDSQHESMTIVFGTLPRIILGGIAAYLVSQTYALFSYFRWKKRLPDMKYLWIRNNVSTILGQIIDTAIFTLIAFYGDYPQNVLVSIGLTTFLFKLLAAILDTPFVYLANQLKPFSRTNKKSCIA